MDHLWQHLGIQAALEGKIQERAYRVTIERAIFAMVANRALALQSKLSTSAWVAQEVALPGVDALPVHQLYRAMDFLLEAQDHMQGQIYDQIAHLLNLEVDLLYFDTTSTYFEIEEADGETGLRQFGHSKDHRPDRPQIVMGLAATRDGLPIRCWSWAGNTSDQAVVKQVKTDLVGWKFGRVVMVVDRGMVSEANLRTLQRAGGQYIAGVKLRSGQPEVQTALSKRRRFTEVQPHLHIKEILVGTGEARQRFVFAYHPQEAKRQAAQRDAMLAELEAHLQRLRTLDELAHTKAHYALRSHPTYGRYLRMLQTGELQLDRTKVRDEAFLDGKYLLTTSDDTLDAADVVLGYKQLLQVEDAFRTLKSRLALQPIFHHTPDRIQAHVVFCWLALLLVRVAENRTEASWSRIRRTLDRLHLVTFQGAHGTVQQRTELTPDQQQLFRELQVEPPPRITEMSP